MGAPPRPHHINVAGGQLRSAFVRLRVFHLNGLLVLRMVLEESAKLKKKSPAIQDNFPIRPANHIRRMKERLHAIDMMRTQRLSQRVSPLEKIHGNRLRSKQAYPGRTAWIVWLPLYPRQLASFGACGSGAAVPISAVAARFPPRVIRIWGIRIRIVRSALADSASRRRWPDSRSLRVIIPTTLSGNCRSTTGKRP